MGQVISVTTTDGPKKLDLEGADQLKIFIGGIWHDFQPPHIQELFAAYLAESDSAAQFRAEQEQVRLLQEQARNFVEEGAEARRRFSGGG